MSESVPPYWAFLSYSSHDRPAAIWLQRALETYRVPPRLVGLSTPAGPAPQRFSPIFRDRSELAADADLGVRITRALADSAYLIVICSPHAARSRWVDEEIVRYRSSHDSSRIFTIIVAGDPDSDEQQCFPPALRFRDHSSRASQQSEPIAADLRPDGDGRRMARLKLVAGMLGVGLDELVRRDDQRHRRRLIAITAASLTGTLLTGALATAALIARNDAQRQRYQAEGLIEFMLTDLRKKLEPSGHLDAMDGAGREALKYYQAQNAASLDAESLARRARALRLMGEIRVQRGNLDEALQNFQAASTTTYELLQRSPLDGQILFNHAQNIFWLGEIAHQRGDLANAETSFQEYRTLAERLATLDGANKEWQAELVYADSALGVLYLQQGQLPEATAAFEKSMATSAALARQFSGDVNWQLELGQGHAWLADASEKAGHLVEARDHSRTQLQIYRQVLAKDPTIRQARFSTVDTLQTLGRLATIEGDQQCALQLFKDSAQQAEELLAGDTENMDLTGVVAIAQIDLGESLTVSGQTAAARTAQRRADQLLAIALSHDNTVTAWRNYRERANLLDGLIEAASGKHADALRIDQAVLARLNTEESEAISGLNTEHFWLLQRSRLQTGDDLSSLGHAQEARALWGTIISTVSASTQSVEPKLMVVLAAAEIRVGQLADAEIIDKVLRNQASQHCDR